MLSITSAWHQKCLSLLDFEIFAETVNIPKETTNFPKRLLCFLPTQQSVRVLVALRVVHHSAFDFLLGAIVVQALTVSLHGWWLMMARSG